MVTIGDHIWITPMDLGFLNKATKRYEPGQLAELLAASVASDGDSG